jgi:hypothetical protein
MVHNHRPNTVRVVAQQAMTTESGHVQRGRTAGG